MCINEAAKLAQRIQREPRDFDHRQGCCTALCHPRRQQKPTIILAFDHEVQPTGVGEMTNYRDSPSGEGMMRIADLDFKSLFLGTMLCIRMI